MFRYVARFLRSGRGLDIKFRQLSVHSLVRICNPLTIFIFGKGGLHEKVGVNPQPSRGFHNFKVGVVGYPSPPYHAPHQFSLRSLVRVCDPPAQISFWVKWSSLKDGGFTLPYQVDSL